MHGDLYVAQKGLSVNLSALHFWAYTLQKVNMVARLAHAHAWRLYFHFQVAVCFLFRTSTCAKRFTWKWLDFHANERTVDIYFIPIVLHKNLFHHRGKSKLRIGVFIHELAQGAFDSFPHRTNLSPDEMCFSILWLYLIIIFTHNSVLRHNHKFHMQ